MKISILSLFYYPEKTGISVTSTELAEYLAGQKFQVTVYTSFPFYPEWKKREQDKFKIYMNEDIHCVKVKRSFVYIPQTPTTIKRILHELSFAISLFINLIFDDKPDIIIAVTPPLSIGLVAIAFSKIKKIKLISNIQDLQPDAAVELGMLKNRFIIILMYKLEKYLYNNSQKIITLSEAMRRKIVLKGIDKKSVYVIPNSVDLIEFNRITKNNFRKKHSTFEKFLVLYSGNWGVKQNIEVILKTARYLHQKQKDIIFFIVGDGAERKNIEMLKNQWDLKNVEILPLVPKSELVDMLHSVDIVLITQREEVVDIVFPSKLLTTLAAGCAVIASGNTDSELNRVVRESQCGVTVNANDYEMISKYIIEFKNKPELVNKYRINAKIFAKNNFDKNIIMSKFIELLT